MFDPNMFKGIAGIVYTAVGVAIAVVIIFLILTFL